MDDSDFFEGVRALLIEKDLKPNWKYKSFREVDKKSIISRFFDHSEEINVDPNVENTPNEK